MCGTLHSHVFEDAVVLGLVVDPREAGAALLTSLGRIEEALRLIKVPA